MMSDENYKIIDGPGGKGKVFSALDETARKLFLLLIRRFIIQGQKRLCPCHSVYNHNSAA